ncbi:hypothetical protein ACVIW2_000408 [Bradyrhizobium huanghuaihaiense]
MVKRIEAEEKTTGGIIIPDSAKEKPPQGEVLMAATKPASCFPSISGLATAFCSANGQAPVKLDGHGL